jgi:hypothetical protein
MDLGFFISILSLLKDHVADSLLIICVLFVIIYQIKETKILKNFLLKSTQTEENHKKYLNKHILKMVRDSSCINAQLTRLLYDLRADRAWVFVFHNSGSDLFGQPFAKITNTNEVTAIGYKSLMAERKDVPVGLMAGYIECLLDNKEIHCEDVDNISLDQVKEYSVKSILKSLGIKSSYSVALFFNKEDFVADGVKGKSSMGEVPLGFVGIDYIREKRTLTDKERQRIHDDAMIIKGFMLSTGYYEDGEFCKIKGK